MLNKNLRAFYTHVARDQDSSDDIVLQPGVVHQANVNRALEILKVGQDSTLRYRTSPSGEWINVDVAPPYSVVYGINRLTETVGPVTSAVSFWSHTDPLYSTLYSPIATPITASQELAERFSDLEATLTINSISNCSLVVGTFINKVATVAVTTLPFYLADKRVHRLYSVKADTIYFEPGVDYVFIPETGEFSTDGLVDSRLTEDITVEIRYAAYIGSVQELEVTSGSITLPESLFYSLALKGSSSTNASCSITLTWQSILDSSKSNNSYVLRLADANTVQTLASASSDVIEFQDVLSKATQAQFLNFQDSIRASSSIPCWSPAKLEDLITYEEYSVWANLTAGYDEYRYSKFDMSVENNPAAVIGEEQVEDPDTPFVAEESVLITDPQQGIDISTNGYVGQEVYKLPAVQGLVRYGDHTLQNGFLNSDTFDTFAPSTEAIIPSSRTGWLASPYLADDMRLLTPESAAWGLIAAAANRDIIFCLLGLQELISQAKKRNWIVDNGNGYVVGMEQAGFTIYFSQVTISDTDPLYPKVSSTLKEVGSNALLGYAACVALATITDSKFMTAFALEGSWVTFKKELLATLESLALFVADGVSLVNFFAAYKHQNGVYSYGLPSLYATTYADYFLSYFLSFKYNATVHHIAARLKESLDNLPNPEALDDKGENPIYATFFERDYQATQYPYDPSYLYTADPNSEDVTNYTKLMTTASIAKWWSDNQVNTDSAIPEVQTNTSNTVKAKAAQKIYSATITKLQTSLGSAFDKVYPDIVIVSSYNKIPNPEPKPPTILNTATVWSAYNGLDLSSIDTIGVTPSSPPDLNQGNKIVTPVQLNDYVSFFYVTGGKSGTVSTTTGTYYNPSSDIITFKKTTGTSYNVGSFGLTENTEPAYTSLGHIFGTYLSKGGPGANEPGYLDPGDNGSWYCQGGCGVYFYFRTIPPIPNIQSINEVFFQVINGFWYAVHYTGNYKIDFIYPGNYGSRDMGDGRNFNPFSPHGPGIKYVDPNGPCYSVNNFDSPAIGANPVATDLVFF